MNCPISQDPCELRCGRQGTDTCLRQLLSREVLSQRRLSTGWYYGVRHIYYPNELPPCVQKNGVIDWHRPAPASMMKSVQPA